MRPASCASAVVILICGTCSSVTLAQSPRPDTSELHPAGKEAVRTFREALSSLEEMQSDAEFKLLDADEATQDIDGIGRDIVSARQRISVAPAADRAGTMMQRGEFARALETLGQALDVDADDPYARYLAGVCALELERYAEATEHFARVRKRESDSRTALLLSELARGLARQRGKLTDMIVMACYDDARVVTEKTFPPPAKADLTAIFALPHLLRDPLLYKLDGEGLAGRGPFARDWTGLAEAALESDDSFELVVAALLNDDAVTEVVYQRLEQDKHQPTLRAIDFLFEYHDGYGFEEQSPEYKRQLAELRREQPDEGLWIALSIPYIEPIGEMVEYRPLSLHELGLLEQATMAKRFTIEDRALHGAFVRLLTKTGEPYRHRYPRTLRMVPTGLKALRATQHRARALIRESFRNGDIATGERAAKALLALADRIAPSGADNDLTDVLIAGSTREGAAEAVLESLPTAHAEKWLEYQRVRVAALAEPIRGYHAVDPVMETLPAARLNAAAQRLGDDRLEEWELQRIHRLANTPEEIDSARTHLRLRREEQPYFRHIVSTGILQQRALLPDLRALRDGKLGNDVLWALIWTLGELRDRASAPWLIERLADERRWVRLAAVDALHRITGADLGIDADAWRRVLDKPSNRGGLGE